MSLSPGQKAHLKTLWEGATIASQLPWNFKVGSVLTEIKSKCQKCDQEMPDEQVRGRLTALSPSLMSIDACIWCKDCNCFMGLAYRVHDDLSFEGFSPTTNRWQRWAAHREAWWDRWWKKIRAAFPGFE